MSPDAPAARPYKRRTLIINGPFQYKFVSVVMGCVAVAIAIIAVDMFSSMGRYVAEGGATVDMKAVYHDSWIAFLVKAVVYMAGVYVVSLVVSHRIAGPMYRFEKSAETVALGDLTTRAFLRKGDEWDGFRESFNGMVQALQEKVSEDVSRGQTLKRLLDELAADGSLSAGLQEKIRRAQAEASAVGSRFKLS